MSDEDPDTARWLTNDLGTHRPTDRIELGYTRRVCKACGMQWPCPETVQAREERLEREYAAYEQTLLVQGPGNESEQYGQGPGADDQRTNA